MTHRDLTRQLLDAIEACEDALTDDEREAQREQAHALIDRLTGVRPMATEPIGEKEALERVQAVIYKYRLMQHYTEWAIAAMVLDALRFPRSDGTVPDA